jgi:glycerol-3-phosphate dehydrogenase
VDRRGPFDVGIIGSGIVGLMVCRRLAREGLRVAVFDKNPGPGLGVTQGQASVIHVVQLPFGSTKSRLARVGNKQYDAICSDLEVPLLRLPALLVVKGSWRVLEALAAYVYIWWNLRGQYRVELAGRGRIHIIEPELSETVSAGIVIHGYGTVDWQKLITRLAESLGRSGVEFYFGTEVTGANVSGEGVDVSTTSGTFVCRYLVNAAGLDSDEMARRLGTDLGRHTPGLGVMAEFSDLQVKTIISPLQLRPSKHTKGGAIIPTTHGTVIFGPTLKELERKEAPPPAEEDLKILIEKFGPLIKRSGNLIRLFSGIRPISPTGDFLIEYTPPSRTLNLVGIESPGLTASPAIADLVLLKLQEAGLGKRVQ